MSFILRLGDVKDVKYWKWDLNVNDFILGFFVIIDRWGFSMKKSCNSFWRYMIWFVNILDKYF